MAMRPCHDISPVHQSAIPPFISSFQSTHHRQEKRARVPTTNATVHTADLAERNTPDFIQQKAKDDATKTGVARSQAAATTKGSAHQLPLLRRQLADAERHDAVSTATVRARTAGHKRALKASTTLQSKLGDSFFPPRSPRGQKGRGSPRSTSSPASQPSPTAASVTRARGPTVTGIPLSHSRSDVKTRTPFLRGIKVPRSHGEAVRGVPSDSWFTADDDFYADTTLDRMALFPLQGIPLRYALDIQQKAAALIDVLPPNLTPESSSLGVVMRHIMLHTLQDTGIIMTDAAKLVTAETSHLVSALRSAWLNRQNSTLPPWQTIKGRHRSSARAAGAAGASSPRAASTNRRSSGNDEQSTTKGRHPVNNRRKFSPRDRNDNNRETDRQKKHRTRHTDVSTDSRAVRFNFDNLGCQEYHNGDRSSSEGSSAAGRPKEYVNASSSRKDDNDSADPNAPCHRSPARGTLSQHNSQETTQARPPPSATCASSNSKRRGRSDSGSDRSDRGFSRNVFRLFYHPIRFSVRKPGAR